MEAATLLPLSEHTYTFMKCINQASGHVALLELSSLWAVELVQLAKEAKPLQNYFENMWMMMDD